MLDLAEQVRAEFEDVGQVEARATNAAARAYGEHYRAGRWGPWAIPVLPGIVCCLGCGRECQTNQSLALHKCRTERARRPPILRRKRVL